MNLNIIKKKFVEGVGRDEGFERTFFESFLEVKFDRNLEFEMKKWRMIRNY